MAGHQIIKDDGLGAAAKDRGRSAPWRILAACIMVSNLPASLRSPLKRFKDDLLERDESLHDNITWSSLFRVERMENVVAMRTSVLRIGT